MNETAGQPLTNESIPTNACGCPPIQPATLAWFFALIGWTALICSFGLNTGAFFEPTDAWVSQTAREMYEKDEWIVPEFSGELRLKKSPGPYWATMLTAQVLGTSIDEVTTRVPNVISAVLIVAVIFWLTRRIAGETAAIYAGFAASASALVLYWSHRGASDLGLTAFTTISLATLWVATEDEQPGWKRNALFLLGYLSAGLGMLYKMPMPLAVVGVPAILYVLIFNRWKVFFHWVHLAGLILFLLPWLPWVIAAMRYEEGALDKWRVEFIDRYSGEMPNVEGQDHWIFLFVYLATTAIYTLPFTVSVFGALAQPFIKNPGVNKRGMWFCFIWFFSLLIFFTSATGKEMRYFLPAIPPIFVLLGVDLSKLFASFNSSERRIGADVFSWIVWIVAPLLVIAAGYGIYEFWYEKLGEYEPTPGRLDGTLRPSELVIPFCVTVGIFAVGASVMMLFIRARRGHYAFGTVVVTMWLVWLWAWPNLFPILVSQAGFRDFAAQFREALPADRAAQLASEHRLVQVAHQDPRIIWFADYRYPRIVDEFEILKEQDGIRDKAYEWRRVGEEIVRMLRSDEPSFIVIGFREFVQFRAVAEELAEQYDLEVPDIHVWVFPRYGRPDRNALLISNVPRPGYEVELPQMKEEGRRRLIDETRRLLGNQLDELAKSIANESQSERSGDDEVEESGNAASDEAGVVPEAGGGESSPTSDNDNGTKESATTQPAANANTSEQTSPDNSNANDNASDKPTAENEVKNENAAPANANSRPKGVG